MSTNETPIRKLLEFFSAKNLDELSPNAVGPKAEKMKITHRDEADIEIFQEGAALFGRHVKTSAFNFEGCGLHIGVFEFAPGLLTPLHSHPDDCVYYVERGSLLMGNREVRAGEGVLTRKNQPYGFVVGPSGARIIEFTTAPRHSVKVHERNMAGWKARLDSAVAKLDSH